MKASRFYGISAAASVAIAAASSCATEQTDTSAAASASNPQQQPPCADAKFHEFDYWLGEWEVFTKDGKKAGDNVITAEEGGCLLVERWTSASGGTGQSYNFVDLETGKWRQVWVSVGATIDYAGGLDETGVMRLEGTIGYGAANPANGAKFKGSWTPEEDGSVTQHFQQYNPATEEWTDWFTGIYRKKSAD